MAKKTTKPKEEKKLTELTIQDFPYVEFTVRAYNTKATDETGGRGILTFVVNTTDVTDGSPSKKLDENGVPINKIGYVGGGMGSVVISIRDEGYFMIPHAELWNALTDALEKEKK